MYSCRDQKYRSRRYCNDDSLPSPRIRSAQNDRLEQINPAPFDGNPEDCFQNTSLHLPFTQYTLPIDTGTHGAQDTETFLIESPISIYDRGRWVADVDVLDPFQSEHFSRCYTDCVDSVDGENLSGLITIDDWEELLGPIHSFVRTRAHKRAWQQQRSVQDKGIKLSLCRVGLAGLV